MDIKNDDIVRYEGDKFFVLTVFEEAGRKFAFMNKITEDEENVTDQYILLEATPNGLVGITDQALYDSLGPRVQSELEKLLADVADEPAE